MLHKYLKIPEEVIQEVLNVAEKYKHSGAEYKTIRERNTDPFPLLKDLLSDCGLTLAFYRVFLHPPFYNHNVIHIDAANRKVALNFPIEKESILHWYEGYPSTALWTEGHISALIAYKENISIVVDNYAFYLKDILAYQNNWIPTKTIKLDRPLLVNTEVWHKAENPSKAPRTLLSFMFEQHISFEDAVELFENRGLTE